jgi:hypothetical protein
MSDQYERGAVPSNSLWRCKSMHGLQERTTWSPSRTLNKRSTISNVISKANLEEKWKWTNGETDPTNYWSEKKYCKMIRQGNETIREIQFQYSAVPLYDLNRNETGDMEKAATWQRLYGSIRNRRQIIIMVNLPTFWSDWRHTVCWKPVSRYLSIWRNISAVEMLLVGKLNIDVFPDLTGGARTLLNYLGNGQNLPKSTQIYHVTPLYKLFKNGLKKPVHHQVVGIGSL